MSWITKYLSQDEIKKIEKAVEKAEESTIGEIVPVIVHRSSAVGHIPLTLTLLGAIILLTLEIPLDEWLIGTSWRWLWPITMIPIYYIAHVVAKWPRIQRIFVPERDELDQVHKRAHLEFFANKINKTARNTGILIFVSVMEKKAVILADEGIAQKLPAATWHQILAVFRQHLSEERWVLGFEQAIEKCGDLLKTHFPIDAVKENQLKNHLVIKE